MAELIRIAFQGDRGAFGEEAALMIWPAAEPMGVPTFEAVVRAVETGAADGGVLPIENRIVGPIGPALAALGGAVGLEPAGEVSVPVALHLLGIPGARLDEIETVGGHPVALAQCRRFLATRRWSVEPGSDSAGLARELAGRPDRTRGVVAGSAAEARYGLDRLAADVHDRADNATRFVAVRRAR